MTLKAINLICTMALIMALATGYATDSIENFMIGGFMGAMIAPPIYLALKKWRA